MRKVCLFLTLALCLTLLCGTVFAESGSISNMKTDCVVYSDGRAQITQTLTVSLDTLEKELRFPLGEHVSRAEVSGYRTSRSDTGGTTVLTLKSKTGLTGMRTFTITYTMDKLVREENGAQALVLPLLCAKWEWPIERYDFTVTMPAEFSAVPSFESGYTADVVEDYMSWEKTATVLSGTVLQPLRDREALTMTLDVGVDYFSGTHSTWSADWTTTILIFVFTALALIYWVRTLRSEPLQRGTRKLPPDSSNPGDLPFLLCGGKANFNMLVLHWASLGYISVYVNQQGNVIFRKRVEMGNERRKTECKLFSDLFLQSDLCDGASLRYKQTAEKAMHILPRAWVRRLYSRESGNPVLMQALSCLVGAIALLFTMSVMLPQMPLRVLVLMLFFVLGGAGNLLVGLVWRNWYLGRKVPFAISIAVGFALLLFGRFGGGLGTMLLSLALALFTGWQTMHGGQRTEAGTQAISQALGFRRFLRQISENRVQMMLRDDPQYFYKYLPYAMAIGQGEAFAERFGEIQLDVCDWYSEAEELPRNAGGFCRHLKETVELLELSVRK